MTRLTPPFPAGQHFVPKMLQKRFVDAAGQLWAFDRRRSDGKLFRTTPENIFKERHVYTVVGPDGAPNDLIERTLGYVENETDPVIERVVTRVRGGNGYDLTDNERNVLLIFLYVQMKRSPEFFRGVTIGERVEGFVEQSIAQWEAIYGPAPPEQRARYLSPAGIAEVEQSARMGSMLTLSPTVLRALDQRGLQIARIVRPDRRFILASFPLVRFRAKSGRRDLGDPGAELWLPIAPDIAIATAGLRRESCVVLVERDDQIRKVNAELASQSVTIASSSSELLRSLTRRRSRSAAGTVGINVSAESLPRSR